MAGIYKIENIASKNCYIGATKNASARFQIHLSELKRNVHHCKKLQQAFNETDVTNFTFTIIEECEDSNIIKVEQKWIDYYRHLNKCYNTNFIATDKGTDSLETRQKKSLAMIGNKNGLGRIVSEEAKEKARQLNLGKTYGAETKEKQRQAKLGKESLKKKAILQMDLKTKEVIKEHKSATDAGKELGIARNNIVKVLQSYRLNAGGYYWKYKD